MQQLFHLLTPVSQKLLDCTITACRLHVASDCLLLHKLCEASALMGSRMSACSCISDASGLTRCLRLSVHCNMCTLVTAAFLLLLSTSIYTCMQTHELKKHLSDVTPEETIELNSIPLRHNPEKMVDLTS